MRLFLHKLTHWEYWPFQLVYIPVYFLWAYYAIKARTLFFFNASNPGIRNGGFMAESKKEIYDIIPPQYYPETILVNAGMKFEDVLQNFEKSTIKYPFVAKPDIGLRGSAVKHIENREQLKNYHSRAEFDFLLQKLIPFKNEVGIFYIRYPDQERGIISGIVSKQFVVITGNGKSSIEQLVMENPRFAFQIKRLRKEYGSRLQDILPDGESMELISLGNHAQGSKFIDVTHLVSDKLTDFINMICLQVPGFYFGRLDIMYDTFEKLERGENFSIIEINGAASEPTHILDPKHSIFFAWKELFSHITRMYEISAANHKLGVPYLSHKQGMEQYRIHLEQNKKIINF